jgi:hypothetical protein
MIIITTSYLSGVKVSRGDGVLRAIKNPQETEPKEGKRADVAR